MKGYAALAILALLSGCTAYADDPGRKDAYRLVYQTIGNDPHVTKVRSNGHVGDDWRFSIYAKYPDNVEEPGNILVGWYEVNPKTGSVRDILDYDWR